jgi:hypothetical protein
MKIRNKVAIGVGGFVLAASVTLGGMAAANADAPAPTSTTPAAPTSDAPSTPSTTPPTTGDTSAPATTGDTSTPDASVAAPALPDGPYDFGDFIATLTRPQQEALLAKMEGEVAQYQASGSPEASEKIGAMVDLLKSTLGQ